MVNMKIERISREIIKPSSPTPPHLRTVKLSHLDQLSPLLYTPIILYYPLQDTNLKIDQTVRKLKNSLSDTLSRFYPLAGRILDHVFINCNDQGISFFEAKVNCDLAEFLKRPQIDLPNEFLPYQAYNFLPTHYVDQVAVQVNIFSDNGIAISVCFLHKIIDGATMSAFLKSWAAIARESYDQAPIPDFSAGAIIFPPRDQESPMPLFETSWFLKQGNGVHRRFVFNEMAISTLIKMAKSELVPNPSRVLAISSFIWKHVVAASRAARPCQHKNSSVLAFAVNMRKKTVPQISTFFAGNMVWRAMATYTTIPGEKMELQLLVQRLRESIAKIDNDYVQRLKGDEGFKMFNEFREEAEELVSKKNPELYIFTSWCNFGFNKVDFGWGKPIWVSIAGDEVNSAFANHIVLMETCSGGGIEAWLLLDEHEMDELENNPEFRKFASLNPQIYVS